MESVELQAIVELLKSQGKMDFYNGATDVQIARFEKENDVQLPQKFRESSHPSQFLFFS